MIYEERVTLKPDILVFLDVLTCIIDLETTI